MKSKILVVVIAALLAIPLTGCNTATGPKQADQGAQKKAVEAAFGSMTSTRIKSN